MKTLACVGFKRKINKNNDLWVKRFVHPLQKYSTIFLKLLSLKLLKKEKRNQ